MRRAERVQRDFTQMCDTAGLQRNSPGICQDYSGTRVRDYLKLPELDMKPDLNCIGKACVYNAPYVSSHMLFSQLTALGCSEIFDKCADRED